MVIADVNVAAAAALAADLATRAVVEKLDVRSAHEWTRVITRAEERFGSVDILVNNAGIADPAPSEQWDTARLQRTLDVNLIGVFNGIQAVAPAMKRAGGGSIVNIGSVGALQGVPMMSGYVVANWGVRGLTKTAALELGAHGIRVNAVHPGQINTPMTSDVTFDTRNVGLGRVGEPDGLARRDGCRPDSSSPRAEMPRFVGSLVSRRGSTAERRERSMLVHAYFCRSRWWTSRWRRTRCSASAARVA